MSDYDCEGDFCVNNDFDEELDDYELDDQFESQHNDFEMIVDNMSSSTYEELFGPRDHNNKGTGHQTSDLSRGRGRGKGRGSSVPRPPPPDIRQLPKAPPGICRVWYNHQECRFGDATCKFKHQGERPAAVAATPAPRDKVAKAKKNPMPNKPVINTLPPAPAGVCRVWHSYQHCPFGEKCRFTHEGDRTCPTCGTHTTWEKGDPECATNASPLQGGEGGRGGIKSLPRAPPGICRLWYSHRDCRFGDTKNRCRFKHQGERPPGAAIGPQVPVRALPRAPAGVCRVWFSQRTCRFGSECKFKHE